MSPRRRRIKRKRLEKLKFDRALTFLRGPAREFFEARAEEERQANIDFHFPKNFGAT